MFRKFAKAASAAALVTSLAAGAFALPATASAHDWAYHHPARHELNHRLAVQRDRIALARAEGRISRGQAHALHAEDHAIRLQERADARADHHRGHLTHRQAHQLNGELNANSRAIR